jgi:DNA-binding transcriptional MocR family regulator
VDGLLALKRATDHSDAMPLQAALAEFVAEGDYDRHLARLRRDLRVRRDAVQSALQAFMPEGTRWTTPTGGYQVWVELPFEIDTGDLLADAVGAGVLFSPGSQFNHDGRASRCMRLTFAMADADDLRRGVEALAGVISARQGSERIPVPRVHI